MRTESISLSVSWMPPVIGFLGLRIQPTVKETLLSALCCAVDQGYRNLIVGSFNLHSLALVQNNDQMRRFYERADLVYVDGMSLVLLGKCFGHDLKREHRCTFLDWFDEFFNTLDRNQWRLFYLGGRRESSGKFLLEMNRRYPQLQLKVRHGYFDDDDAGDVVGEINAFAPHIVLVGMGMPRQESWIVNNEKRISTNLILAGGAMLEYLSGEKVPAPRWMGRMGLEWLFRLATEPTRLANRYLREPAFLIPLFLRQWRGRLGAD